MRLSHLLIAVAAAFPASALAVLPPESQGPRLDPTLSPQASMPSSSAEERDQREENSWLSTRPNDVWQSKARSEASQSTEPANDAQSPAPTVRSLPSDPAHASQPMSREIGRSQEESS